MQRCNDATSAVVFEQAALESVILEVVALKQVYMGATLERVASRKLPQKSVASMEVAFK